MQTDVIMAGFGGQGLMLIGQLLAYSALKEGKETSWLPSYGPEMRGGTANCTVVVSDKMIGSPVVYSPTDIIVMNKPSLERFGKMVKKNGHILINSSLIDIVSGRDDVDEYRIPATQSAIDMGNAKVANVFLLGSYIAITEIVEIDTVKSMIQEKLKHKGKMVDLNLKTLQKGYDFIKAGH